MFRRTFVLAVIALVAVTLARAQEGTPQIPRTWDDEAVAALELPLANPAFSPRHVSADYYYRMPVRPVYKTYPVYAPDHEPPGYIDRLKQLEPEVMFDPATLHTEADWIRAGELVFDAPVRFEDLAASPVRFAEFYANSGVKLGANGSVPGRHYVIRQKGVVEVGQLSCGQCHTRVMPDGAIIKGAQGNFPFGFLFAARARRGLSAGIDQEQILARFRGLFRRLYGAPWIQPPPEGPPDLSVEEILSTLEAHPHGVTLREGTSLRYPAQLPDLIGIRDRRYLDRTGLVFHRSIGDLMRYAALNQDTQQLAAYGDFVPDGRDFRVVPEPQTRSRYSDEQLYALAQYLYALKPPPNPNRFDDLAARGQQVFARERCGSCHTPPLYTNNMLTPADGFEIPEGHLTRFDIMPVFVGTHPTSALKTRRGTGYYKVPSLKGVWYRGPFEHNASVATLEDWFDPARLRDEYVPTGYVGPGVKARAVPGHRFGLGLSPDEKRALIAFLKTL